MRDPLVSIVTPCYRQGRFLGESIECVLNQTYSNIEHIVVNDGSDDNTEEVAKRYGNRIRYLSKLKGERSAARNAGINIAEGSYLLFMDADDLLHPEALSWLVEAMEDREDRVAIMGFRSFKSSTQRNESDHVPGPSFKPLPFLIRGNWGPPHSILCSRKMVNEIGGFNDKLSVYGCEDWDLWFRLALAGTEFVTVQRVGAFYRRHGDQSTVSVLNILLSGVEVIQLMHRAILKRPDLLQQYGDELLTAEYRVLRSCLANGVPKQHAESIHRIIRELGQHGFRSSRSSVRHFLDRVLGHRSELIQVMLFRLLRPNQYESYKTMFDCNETREIS